MRKNPVRFHNAGVPKECHSGKLLPIFSFALGLLSSMCAAAEPLPEAGHNGIPLYPNLVERCMKCHEEVASASEMPHTHSPFVEGKCMECHDPHASDIPGLLRRNLGDQCLRCHGEDFQELPLARIHTPVREGDCTGCHLGHASQEPHLLKQTGAQLCFSCHEDLRGQVHEPHGHPDFKQGECEKCHSAHLAFTESFAEGSSTGCVECHATGEANMQVAHDHLVHDDSPCRECHRPHTAPQKGMVRPGSHTPMKEGKCADCHEGTDHQLVLQPSIGTGIGELNCLKCHEEVEAASSEAGGHSQFLPDKCLICHTPHTSDSEFLLKSDTKSLCLDCHPTVRRELVAESVHEPAKEGKCAECHTTHKSEFPSLLRQEQTALCQSCHPEDNHKLAHPIGKEWEDKKTGQIVEIIDPRTGKTLDCFSCHTAHGSPYEYLLTHAGGRTLCIQCHTF